MHIFKLFNDFFAVNFPKLFIVYERRTESIASHSSSTGFRSTAFPDTQEPLQGCFCFTKRDFGV